MHKKGISGIRLGYLAALAFLFAITGQTVICGLMMLAAIFLEKNEWLGRQTMQALLLRLVFQAISWIFSGIYSGLVWLDYIVILTDVFRVIEAICFLLLCLLGIIGIFNVIKDKEADLPVLSGIAYRAYGRIRPVYASHNPMQYPQPPIGSPQYHYPPVQQPPMQQPPVQQPPVTPQAPPPESVVKQPVQQPPVQQPSVTPQTPPPEFVVQQPVQQASMQQPSYTVSPPSPAAPPVQTAEEASNPPLDQRPDQPAE